MNINLLTFCSSNYVINKNIVPNEAKSLNIFNNIFALNENDLDKEIYNVIQTRIKKYGERLYGYSSWRPYLILKYLNQINDNDILVYMDSDFISLNENINVTNTYILNVIDRLKNNKIGIIGQGGEGSNDLLYTTYKLRKCVEKYLNYEFSFEELNNWQYASGLIFIRKCKKSIEIIKLWNEILQNNFELVTDIHNNDKDNYDGFIDNRHEQSIWSLLCKYYHIESTDIPIYDIFFNWNYNFNKYK